MTAAHGTVASRASGGSAPYRRFLQARSLSLIGDGLISASLAFAALDLGASAGQVGVTLLAARLPLAVFTLGGGVLSDRVPRRTILIASDVLRVGTQGLTALILLTGVAELWQLALLQAAAAIGTGYFNAAAIGMLADLLPDHRRQSGNALVGISQSLATLIAPGLAAALVALGGVGAAFAADAATFLLSLALLSGLPVIAPAPRESSLVRDVVQGWQEFRKRRWMWVMALQAAIANGVCIAPIVVLGPIVAQDELGGIRAWSTILTSFAVGALAGGVLALRWHPRWPLLASTVLMAFLAPYLIALATVGSVRVIAAAAFLAGGQASCYNTFTITAAQNHLPSEILGRVTSLTLAAGICAQPVGIAVAGVAADAVGADTVLWAAGLATVALVLGVLAVPSVRNLPALPSLATTTVAPEAHTT